MIAMKYLTTSTGYQIPAFGLGTWQGKAGELENVIKEAIDVGYRYFDCAYIYGNEAEVGKALSTQIAAGIVKREDIFLTSKLWNTYHRPDLVKKNLNMTLERLQTDYIDLYLIHWPMAYVEDGIDFPKDNDGNFIFSEVDYLDTWKAMEALVDEGIVRAIGVCNMNKSQLERVITNARIPCSNIQIESSPYLPNTKLIEFALSKGVTVTAYSPLGSPERPWATPDHPKLIDSPILAEIAKKYNKSPAQIVFRFQIDRGCGVIPKTSSRSRLIENMDIFDFALLQDDIVRIASLERDFRAVPLTWAGIPNHKFYPFHDEY